MEQMYIRHLKNMGFKFYISLKIIDAQGSMDLFINVLSNCFNFVT